MAEARLAVWAVTSDDTVSKMNSFFFAYFLVNINLGIVVVVVANFIIAGVVIVVVVVVVYIAYIQDEF